MQRSAHVTRLALGVELAGVGEGVRIEGDDGVQLGTRTVHGRDARQVGLH
jgi:hypothetical protein